MSLQTNAVLTQFVTNCANLWKRWNKRDGYTHREDARKEKVRQAINALASFMVVPPVQFNPIGGWGAFNWGLWTLDLNNKYTAKHNIKYGVFVEYCSTIYHETRHAEQFYRIAQGLAQGRLTYPDTSERGVINKIGGKGLSVQQKISLFGGGQGVAPSQLLPTTKPLAQWLGIPLNVAQHALNGRANFDVFTALPKPAWFKRSTTLLEVEDWMRATYKKTFSQMDSFAQRENDTGDSLRRNVYKMYRDLPEEHDAHAIEHLVVEALTTRIGHIGSENERRDNVALFGH